MAQEAVTGLEVLDYLLNSVGGYYTANRLGQITVGRLLAPTATASTDAVVKATFDDADLERGSLSFQAADKPPWRIDIGYARNWAVLTADQIAGGATTADRAFALEEFRVESATRTATQTKHPLAKPLRRDTGLDAQADAATEAARLSALISVGRQTVKARLQTQPLALELGDEVWVESALYDLDAAFRVIAIDENASEGRAGLTLWR